MHKQIDSDDLLPLRCHGRERFVKAKWVLQTNTSFLKCLVMIRLQDKSYLTFHNKTFDIEADWYLWMVVYGKMYRNLVCPTLQSNGRYTVTNTRSKGKSFQNFVTSKAF